MLLLDTGRVGCRLHVLAPFGRDAGGLAQLVEHGIENAGVPGSSPGVAIPFRTRRNRSHRQEQRTRTIPNFTRLIWTISRISRISRIDQSDLT